MRVCTCEHVAPGAPAFQISHIHGRTQSTVQESEAGSSRG